MSDQPTGPITTPTNPISDISVECKTAVSRLEARLKDRTGNILTAQDIKNAVSGHHFCCSDKCGCECGRSYDEKWNPIISRLGRNAPDCKCVPMTTPTNPVRKMFILFDARARFGDTDRAAVLDTHECDAEPSPKVMRKAAREFGTDTIWYEYDFDGTTATEVGMRADLS